MSRDVLINVRDTCMARMLEFATEVKGQSHLSREQHAELLTLSMVHSTVINHLKSLADDGSRSDAVVQLDTALGVLTDLALEKTQVESRAQHARALIHSALAYLEGE